MDIVIYVVIVVVVLGIVAAFIINRRQQAKRKKDKAYRFTNEEGQTDLLITQIKTPPDKKNKKN